MLDSQFHQWPVIVNKVIVNKEFFYVPVKQKYF